MPTKFPDLFAALAAPLDAQEVRSRSQGGRQVQYITARTVMNRLDSVLGPENWWDEYIPGENSVLCRLTVRLPDGATLTKADAGGYAGMADSGDDDKSGFSDAFKRAAVKFGVGRYLYRDGVPSFTTAEPDPVPTPAIPKPRPASQGNGAPSQARPPYVGGGGGNNGNGSAKPPTSGKALFAWTREQEQRHEVGLLKYLNSWAKLQDFPGRMIDWDSDQVSQGYLEGARKLESLSQVPVDADHGDAYEGSIQ